MHRRVLVGLIALVLVIVAGGAWMGVRWWSDRDRSELEQAVALVPADAQRLSWTDWAGVRRSLGVSLSTDSTSAQVRSFLDDGFDADLTSTSALVQSAPEMQVRYGFSPASIDWELFSQADDGALIVMHLPDSISFDTIEADLTTLGYTPPDAAGGVWIGGAEVVARLNQVTPELNHLVLDADAHLVYASDASAYLTSTVSSSDLDPGLGGVVAAMGSPVSAAIYAGDYACEALAMASADPADQTQAAELIAQAGKVNPMTGFAIAYEPGGQARVAMGFESHDQARANADSRAALAAGPAPGQGGDFSDRFELGPVTAEGSVVTMQLTPLPESYLLSDLSTGPVLFATC